MPPTIACLRFLAEHRTAEAALRAARLIGTPPTILPKLRRRPDGTFGGLAFPGDADYDALD